MLRAFRGFLEFMREINRGQAMMRGEVEPGTYERRRRKGRRCKGDRLQVSRCRGRQHRERRKRRSPVERKDEELPGGAQFEKLYLPDVLTSLKHLGELGRHLHSGGGHRSAVLALLLAMTLWGSVFVATKEVMGEAGPFTVAAGRFAIGLVVLLPLARREGFEAKLILSRTYLLFGFTGVFLAYGLQNLALVFTSAGNAALVVATQPAAVVLMGMLFLREKLPPARLLGIGLAMVGVLLVSSVAFSSGGADALLGNALMVGAVLAYGAYAAQGWVLGANHPPSLTTAASFGAGLLFMLPFAAGEIYLNGIPKLGTEGWLVLLYLGVSTTAATFLLWNYALRHLEAGAAGLYFNLLPVTGLGFAILFGGHVGLVELAGGALAIAGVLLGDHLVRKRTTPVYEEART